MPLVHEGAGVLVAIDGGPQVTRILAIAAEAVAGTDAPLHVLCVADTGFSYTSAIGPVSEEAIATVEDGARETADKAVAALAAAGHTATAQVIDGPPDDVIASAAKTLNCGLIVVGHRHRSFLGYILDASVCSSLLERAPCPVLVVPDDPLLAATMD